MPKKDATAGERLCTYIRREVLLGELWPQVIDSLTPLARANELAAFFEELVAVQLAGRLVSGGKMISESIGGIDQIASEEFEKDFLAFIRETTELTGKRRKEVEKKILTRASDAVRVARKKEIPRTVEAAVLRFAKNQHPHCYLCGRGLVFARADELDALTAEPRKRVYEAEHIWPLSYGGDSDEDNLLPACSECNRIKDNYPCWAIVDVQSLTLGINPSPQDLGRVSGLHRFSLLSRAAWVLADTEGITLKEAFVDLGPGIAPYVYRPNDAADFFNLRNTTRGV